MFTKPSLGELLDGVAKTAEEIVLPTVDDPAVAEQLVEMLVVLDRVRAEWSSAAHLLTIDNRDLRTTLERIAAPPLNASSGAVTVDELAVENRQLRAALTDALETLDLPADEDAPPDRRAADRAVLELLERMLQREREAHPPTPSRVNPLSKAAAPLSEAEQARMAAALQSFIAGEMPEATDVAVTAVQTLAGGASREAFTFVAAWTSPDGPVVEQCVMLRNPVSSVLESDESETSFTGSRRVARTEFRMLRCMEASGIPVPHMLWVEPTGTCLERPFSVARLIDGESDLSKLAAEPHLERMLEQYVEILARVHTLDPADAGVDFLNRPTCETAASQQVELFASGVERQRLEEFPALAYMIRWLRKHQPTASRVSVVHGDFRLGNFMWDADGIIAMLDWEQCHLGDPLEELAFMYWELWTLNPLVPIDDLISRYEAASGIPVDHEALAYYRVFIELKMSVVLLTGLRSFYTTEQRQLSYGGSLGFGMLRDCQLRFVDELLNDGPTIHFGARLAAAQST